MAKQPFTESGVQDKFDELYALNDSDLILQAEAAKSDLKTWVADNFLLDTDQQTFLSNLTDDWTDAAGEQLGIAMKSRLNVTITIGTTPDPDLPPWVQGKWINYHEVPIFTNPGDIATGSLKFEIGYSG